MTKASRRRWHRASRSGGFTLIELLVVMALVALAVSLLPGSLRLGLQATAFRGELDRGARLAATLASLEQRLAQSMPLFERDSLGGIRVQFRGDAATLEFVGPSESGPSGPGVYQYRIGPVARGDGMPGEGLVLELSLYDPQGAQASRSAPGTRHEMLGPDTTVRFRYFGRASPAGAAGWHAEWQRPDLLPSLIEMTATAGAGPTQLVRRIVAAPRVEARS